MAGKRLIFDDNLSESDVDSQPGSNSERGNDFQVTLVEASMHMGLDPERVSEAVGPHDVVDLEFKDEPIVATLGPVEASRPCGSFLNKNPSSTFKEFDMLRLRYMFQIAALVEIYAPLPYENID